MQASTTKVEIKKETDGNKYLNSCFIRVSGYASLTNIYISENISASSWTFSLARIERKDSSLGRSLVIAFIAELTANVRRSHSREWKKFYSQAVFMFECSCRWYRNSEWIGTDGFSAFLFCSRKMYVDKPFNLANTPTHRDITQSNCAQKDIQIFPRA